jgi:hypothetical protein
MFSLFRGASLLASKTALPKRGVSDFFEQSLLKDKETKKFPPVGKN